MSLYDRAKVFFSAAAGAGNKGVAYNIKPEEKLKVDEHVTNGSFTGSDGWEKTSSDITFSHGKAVFSGVDDYKYLRTSTPVFEKGKTYKVSFTVTDFTSVGNSNPHLIVQESSNQQPHIGSIKTSGKYVFIYEAKGHESNGVQIGTPSKLVFKNSGPGGSGNEISLKLDNVSVREVEQKANDFSFVRASDLTATHEGADGLIKKTRENLFTFSNDPTNAAWGKAGITVTSGFTGYHGDPAFKLTKTAHAYRQISQAISDTGVKTISVYAKKGSLDVVTLFHRADGFADTSKSFNLTSGSLGNTNASSNFISASIESVGNGWYRCSMTYNHVSGNVVRIYPGWSDQVAGDIFIQNAQLEPGMVATPYIHRTDSNSKSTAGIQENEPRYDYSLDNSLPPVLMLEPERKNEVPNSEGVVEATNSVTLTVNHGIAPDGTKSSLKVAKNGSDQNERILPISNDNVTLTNSGAYSISAFVKNIDCTGVTTIACRTDAGSNELFRQGFQWTGASLALTSTGASGTRTKAFVESYGNNWWRIGFTFTANSTAGNFELDIDRVNGSATTSIETWGWQLEKGPYATSYIPTYGSAATRLGEAHNNLASFRCELDKPLTKKYSFVVDVRVDNLERPTTNFDDIFVARSQGALFNEYPFRIEGYYNPNDDPDTYTLRVFAYKIGDTGSGTNTPHTNGIQLGVRNKIAIVFDEDSGIKIFVNGNSTPMAQSTEAGEMHNVHFLEGGGNPRSKTFLYGVQAYDEALSDAECVSLTTIS